MSRLKLLEEKKQAAIPHLNSHMPNDVTRAFVVAGKVCGHPHATIAQQLGICMNTLEKHYSYELLNGVDHCNNLIASTLFQKAVRGDTACLIFWAKTRMGWKETQVHEFIPPKINLLEQAEDVTDA